MQPFPTNKGQHLFDQNGRGCCRDRCRKHYKIYDETNSYNTDAHGFEASILPHLKAHHKAALILGTGGASKAVAYTFKKLGINYKYVSRTSNVDNLTYVELDAEIMAKFPIVVNCWPIGTHPNVSDKPALHDT